MEALKKAVLARKKERRRELTTDDDDDSENSSSEEEFSTKRTRTDVEKSKDPTFEISPVERVNSVEVQKEAEEDTGREKKVLDWLVSLLQDWLDEVNILEKKNAHERALYAAAKECEAQIEPLFQELRKKTLSENILTHLEQIIKECNAREYRKAFDRYIDLTIGNAPWPIGVTMVGIHARSGREKISASKISHIMKDETVRAYLTSVKRLMSRCQAKYPPDAPSKRMN